MQASPLSLEKDMERVEGMRARNVARTNRFLNARLRTIGLDTDALDEQMREQRAREEMEGVSDRVGRIVYIVLQSMFRVYIVIPCIHVRASI